MHIFYLHWILYYVAIRMYVVLRPLHFVVHSYMSILTLLIRVNWLIHMSSPVSAQEQWGIWLQNSCATTHNYDTTKAKLSTTCICPLRMECCMAAPILFALIFACIRVYMYQCVISRALSQMCTCFLIFTQFHIKLCVNPLRAIFSERT